MIVDSGPATQVGEEPSNSANAQKTAQISTWGNTQPAQTSAAIPIVPSSTAPVPGPAASTMSLINNGIVPHQVQESTPSMTTPSAAMTSPPPSAYAVGMAANGFVGATKNAMYEGHVYSYDTLNEWIRGNNPSAVVSNPDIIKALNMGGDNSLIGGGTSVPSTPYTDPAHWIVANLPSGPPVASGPGDAWAKVDVGVGGTNPGMNINWNARPITPSLVSVNGIKEAMVNPYNPMEWVTNLPSVDESRYYPIETNTGRGVMGSVYDAQ